MVASKSAEELGPTASEAQIASHAVKLILGVSTMAGATNGRVILSGFQWPLEFGNQDFADFLEGTQIRIILDPDFRDMSGHVPRNVFHTIDFLLEFSPMIRNKAQASVWQMFCRNKQ